MHSETITFDDRCLITGKNAQTFSYLHEAAAHTTCNGCAGRLAFEYIRDWEAQWRGDITSGGLKFI